MPFGLGEILNIGTALGSAFIGANAARHDSNVRLQGQREANATNIELARQQRDWNYEMWRRQSRYNLPANQMKRLKAAGLNPHLMYGQGTVGNAEQVRGYDRATVQNEKAGYRAFEGILGHAMQAVQASNVRANTQVAKQQAINAAIEAEGKAYDNVIKAENAGVAKELTAANLQAAQENVLQQHEKTLQSVMETAERKQKIPIEIRKALVDLVNAQKEGSLKDQQKQMNEFELKLNKEGLTKSDNLFYRYIATGINSGEINQEVLAEIIGEAALMGLGGVAGKAFGLGRFAKKYPKWLERMRKKYRNLKP